MKTSTILTAVAAVLAISIATPAYATDPPGSDLQIQRDIFKAEREMDRIYGADVASYCRYRWRISGLAAAYEACLESYGTKVDRELNAELDAARKKVKQAERNMDEQYGAKVGAYCRTRWATWDSKGNRHLNVPALQACLEAKGM